jgi:catechol 2,3-dioxygenase-like lactoylglutathione lyase family enzyme
LCQADLVAICGAHVVVFSSDPDADRRFFRDVLDFSSVDAGGGWLIFKLPPAELAVHPGGSSGEHELYLMCDNLDETMDALRGNGVEFAEVTHERWGHLTRFRLPGGSTVGVYEPLHPRAIDL